MQTQLEAQILLGSICMSPLLGRRQSTAAGEGVIGVTRFFRATQRQENETEMTENCLISRGRAGHAQAGKLATAK